MDSLSNVLITPQKRILHPKGDILHALKRSAPGYVDFGEAYFSIILPEAVKGWKRHRRMTLNLVVPVGDIRFIIHDNCDGSETYGQFLDIRLGNSNYARLTIPPMLWVAFKGIGSEFNLLLNIANEEHDPNEADNVDLSTFRYSW